MIPVSTAEKNFGKKTFFVSTFLDKYNNQIDCTKINRFIIPECNSYAQKWIENHDNSTKMDILTHQNIVTISEIPPTCISAGATEGSLCTSCGSIIQEQVPIEALGHDWRAPDYIWDEDNTTVTAIHTCNRDNKHTETETVNTIIEYLIEPTCENNGEANYTTQEFENPYFDVQSKENVIIEASGHIWAEPVYTWSDDKMTITAEHICRKNEMHKEEETVATFSEVTKEATCTNEGEITYTSNSFVNNAFTIQTLKIALNQNDNHKWKEPVYIWNEDNLSVVATRTCEFNEAHVETEIANASSIISKQPTCEKKGETTYTSEEFTNPAFSIQSKVEMNIDAIGHNWSEPRYIWYSDNTHVSAARVCLNDNTHRETEEVNVNRIIIISPTDNDEGLGAYNINFQNEAFESQIRMIPIPALNNLEKLVLPLNIETIEEEAFSNTLFEAIIIPDSCKKIEAKAFANCMRLIYVQIPQSIIDIAPDSFENCPAVIIDYMNHE